MASCVSTDRELSFEWSHHRISSIESKVKVTLQNPIKQSGSERVNRFHQNASQFQRRTSNSFYCQNQKTLNGVVTSYNEDHDMPPQDYYRYCLQFSFSRKLTLVCNTAFQKYIIFVVFPFFLVS